MIGCPFCGFDNFSTCQNLFSKNNFLQVKKHSQLFKMLRKEKITSHYLEPEFYYISFRNYLYKLISKHGRYKVYKLFSVMPRLLANTEYLNPDKINDFLINTMNKLDDISNKICGISHLFCVIVGTSEIPLLNTLKTLSDLNLDFVIGLGGGRGFYEYIISKYLNIPVLNYDIIYHAEYYVKSELKSMQEVCELDISTYQNILFTLIWPAEFGNKIPTKTLLNIAKKYKNHSGQIYIMIIMGPNTFLYGDGTLMSFMDRKSSYNTDKRILKSLKTSWGKPIYSTKSFTQRLIEKNKKQISNGVRIHKLSNFTMPLKKNKMCLIL